MMKLGALIRDHSLLTLLAMISADGHYTQRQEPYFPGLAFLPDDKDVNSIIDETISVHLKAMNEPSLWMTSQKDRTALAYRILWLHPGKPQVCIRLGRTGKAFILHVAGHDGPPGITAGRLSLSKDVNLSIPQGERLVGLLEKTMFWTSPAEVKETRGIADGDGIVIEGIKDGKYHVINRAGSSTGEGHKSFCRSLLKIANEPGLLKEWDRLRNEERKSPGYRPEPSQTEDRGDKQSDPNAW